MSRTDMTLLLAWRDDDRRAGDEFVGRHYRAIYRFFASKLADPNEVEDLVQRTFMAATAGLERFAAEASGRTWLYAIARNLLRQWFEVRGRSRGREEDLGESSIAQLEPGPGPSTIIELAAEQRLLLEALRRLPLDAQLILELRYWEGLKTREIAVVLGCPANTARSRVGRAKQDLRAILDRLTRTEAQLESTMHGLETWAAQLRNAWQEPA